MAALLVAWLLEWQAAHSVRFEVTWKPCSLKFVSARVLLLVSEKGALAWQMKHSVNSAVTDTGLVIEPVRR